MDNHDNWPPVGDLPDKSRMILGDELEWGMTQYDNLSRAELLILLRAFHSALSSSHSVLEMYRDFDQNGQAPFWQPGGRGWVAMTKADTLYALSGAGNDAAYGTFFRYADGLMFPGLAEDRLKGFIWGINDETKTLLAPSPGAAEGFRPMEWRDLHVSCRDDGDAEHEA